ncbi:MAG TPA: acyl-CoA dehydrogenase family protein [Solirubrobacteraceae bacterium]|nr:acyl-CoA dehydrogenase family protein [Solirubrobacteraceae bacterium]
MAAIRTHSTTPAAAPEGADLVAAIGRAAALARDGAREAESARALTPALLDELRATGLMRAGAAASLGALEAPPATTLSAAESIACGDASAGWCVSIAATSSLLSAYLPERGAQEIFSDPTSIAAGVWAPSGRAVPADGGVRVSGRWAFCSGISHSRWLFAGCVLDDGRGAAEAPALRIVGMPTADLEILDTWHTSGLRGTGSHDALADGVLVPDHRVLSLMDGGPRVDAPLYRFPIFGFFALSIAAAALGNARGAVADLCELAAGKTSQGSSRVLAERPATQAAVAEAEAQLRAARALYYQAIEDAWGAAQADGPVGVPLRLGLRLAATHAVRTSAEVARSMYDLGGGTAIYEDSPLQRRFRDAHAATAHFQVNPATWELAGRVLLGLPTKTAQL